MKTILLILILLSNYVFSQWSNITDKYTDGYKIRSTIPFAVNGDSIYVFSANVGWFSSYDNGDNWKKNKEIFRDKYKDYEDNFVGPGSTTLPPIFKNNKIYIFANSNELLISNDYGKTYKRAEIKKSNYGDGYKFYEVRGIYFDEDNMYLAGARGVYISYDGGYSWYHKNVPGMILNHGEETINPDERGYDIPYDFIVHSILIKDDFIIFNGDGQAPAIYKTIKYPKDDSINSLYFNIDYTHFSIENENNDTPKFGTGMLSRGSLIEIRKRIFTIFTTGGNYHNIGYSDDEGDTWDVLIEPQNELGIISQLFKCEDILYASVREKGIFMSTDLGETWELLNKGFDESPDNLNYHLIYGYLQFNEKYAYVNNGLNLYRAPLKDCKIVTEQSSVEKIDTEPKIYPNPTSESITISGIGQGIVTIYNTLGQKLI